MQNPTLVHGLTPIGEDGSSVMNVTLAEGTLWTDMRKFMLKSLSDLGMGNRDTMEDVIDQEAQQITRVLEQNEGQPMLSKVLTT